MIDKTDLSGRDYKNVLNMVTQDIKANRLNWGKMTYKKDIASIAEICKKVYQKNPVDRNYKRCYNCGKTWNVSIYSKDAVYECPHCADERRKKNGR